MAALAIPQHEIDREMIARRGFAEFIRRAWRHVDSSPLSWNWHIDAIAEHLVALSKREIRDLVINIPPGCNKSIECSVLFPSYIWTIEPTHRFLMCSYDNDLVFRDARKMRTLVSSEWYRSCWPDVVMPSDRTASVAVGIFYNTLGGMRVSTTLGGGVTGKHAHTAGVDDPIDTNGASAASGKELDRVITFWRETLPTRFANPRDSARFCVMQRLHERDLAAEMIRDGATVLCLPMRFESKHPNRWVRDPRTEEGELLHPDRFPEEVVARLEKTLGPMASAAQLQQRPSPAGGGVFKLEWFKYWTELPPGGTWTMSVDCAFKVTADSSYVVIQVWYSAGPNFYLVDQRRERMSFSATANAIKAKAIEYPKAYKKLVEDKANGSAVVDTLKRDIPGFVLVEPEGGKEARANAVEPLVAAGNVFLPDPINARYLDGSRGAPWVTTDFLPEVTVFPKAATDDQVDTMTQYLNHAGPNSIEGLRAAMAAVGKALGR